MDKEILFEALNAELGKENIELEIICVGGFVLSCATTILYSWYEARKWTR